MQSFVHLAVAAALAFLALRTMRIWRRDRRIATLIVAGVGTGLVYDNAVLGVGRFVGHGPELAALSWPRFAIHALLTPLLVVVGARAAAALGRSWARARAFQLGALLVSTILVVLGVVNDLLRLDLTARRDGDVVSFGNAAGAAPIPAIVTIVVLLGLGAWISTLNPGVISSALRAAIQ